MQAQENHSENNSMAQQSKPFSIQDMSGCHPLLQASYAKIMKPSAPVKEGTSTVRGQDFNKGVDYQKVVQGFSNVGFQATHLGRAIQTVNDMIDCKLQPIPADNGHHNMQTSEGRKVSNCSIMLGFTSNQVSSGNREILRYLAQHNMVDCMVTTTGAIEEDFMKCMANFYIGDFNLKGAEMYARSHNRTGNLIVPNGHYVKFAQWLWPILDTMLEEQKQGYHWTPSKMIWRMGREINNPDSVFYWAYKNRIPVLCPAITDGAIGDNLWYHRHRHPEPSLRIDIVEDIQVMNDIPLFSVNTGVLLLGAGLIKHHILNSNCSRAGSNFSVYINTASEFDGSDSGATPDEAVSWGKIASGSAPVKVFADATIVLPFLVGETFAKREAEFKAFNDKRKE